MGIGIGVSIRISIDSVYVVRPSVNIYYKFYSLNMVPVGLALCPSHLGGGGGGGGGSTVRAAPREGWDMMGVCPSTGPVDPTTLCQAQKGQPRFVMIIILFIID